MEQHQFGLREWADLCERKDATIAALQARVRELEQPVYVCQGCGRLGRDGWLPTSFTSDELRGSVQCPDCGCIDREKNTARELAAICTKAQSELAQRTAELEAAKAQLKTVTENAIAIFSHNTCDAHNQEINKESFATFLEKEKVRGCIRCMHAELERVRGTVTLLELDRGSLERQVITPLREKKERYEREALQLRTLILALPKVEGQWTVSCAMADRVVEGGIVSDISEAVAAIVQHRQGMEG